VLEQVAEAGTRRLDRAESLQQETAVANTAECSRIPRGVLGEPAQRRDQIPLRRGKSRPSVVALREIGSSVTACRNMRSDAAKSCST
jgi:hypothetical protein